MEDGMNVIVGAVKTRDNTSYFDGVSSDNLKNWSAADEKDFKDAKYCITIIGMVPGWGRGWRWYIIFRMNGRANVCRNFFYSIHTSHSYSPV